MRDRLLILALMSLTLLLPSLAYSAGLKFQQFNKAEEGKSGYLDLVGFIENATAISRIELSIDAPYTAAITIDKLVHITEDAENEIALTNTNSHYVSKMLAWNFAQSGNIHLRIHYNVLNDNKVTGNYQATLSVQVAPQNNNVNLKTIDLKESLNVEDSDVNVVCASNYALKHDSCFDVFIGTIGIMDANGSLEAELYMSILARSKDEIYEGQFETIYYRLPELSKDEDNKASPFTGEGNTLKITNSHKWHLGKNYHLALKLGARTATEQEHRDKDISPFFAMGIERVAKFDSAMGVGGIMISKDAFWKFNEVDDNGNKIRARNYSERALIYGHLAVNDSGTTMLGIYMDFNIDGRGPGEAGISITFGGKWKRLLSAFGNI